MSLNLLDTLRPDAARSVYRDARPVGQSSYLNLGYWRAGALDFDRASLALVRLVAERAGLAPGGRLVDCGCGRGDQDVQWAREYGLASIVAVETSPTNIEAARARVSEAGLNSVVQIVPGSATRTRLPTASCDAVIALESALHFDTREDFFCEAFRLLAPEGRLVTADIIPRTAPRRTWTERLIDAQLVVAWSVPPANLVDASTYATQLENAGFDTVTVERITDDVFPQFTRHLERMLGDAAFRARVGPAAVRMWQTTFRMRANLDAYDYVLTRAVKPGVP